MSARLVGGPPALPAGSPVTPHRPRPAPPERRHGAHRAEIRRLLPVRIGATTLLAGVSLVLVVVTVAAGWVDDLAFLALIAVPLSWLLVARLRDHSAVVTAQHALASLAEAQEELAWRAQVVEDSNDAIITMDLTGTILTWNKAAERLYGYRSEETIGRGGAMLVPPATRAVWASEITRYVDQILEGQSVSVEVQRARKDGSIMDLSLTLSPLRDRKGDLIGTAGISRDITARKATESARARLAAIVESSDDAIIGKSLDGTILAWNRGAERLYGYPADEIIGQNIARLAPPEQSDEVTSILRKIRAGASVQHLETTRVRKDGSHVDVSVTVSPVVDDAGQLIGASTITRDITAQRWAEEALRESEERFRLALSNAPIGIALVSLDGRWLQVNPALCAIVGRSELDLVGLPAADITHPDDVAADAQLVERLLAGEVRSYQVEKRYFHQDGHPLWILLSVSLVRDTEGAPRYFITQIEDTSDRKRGEMELRNTNERLRSTLAESERQWRELSLLNEMGDVLLSCATPAEAYEVVAHFSERLFPAASGMVLRSTAQVGSLEAVASWGRRPPPAVSFTSEDCWALRRGKVHRVAPPSSTIRCRHLDTSADWSLCIPLMAQGEVLGLFHVHGTDPGPGGGETPLDAIERLTLTIAEHLSLAVANLQLRETLRSQSLRDPLTGLYNRRYMDDCLERELREASRAAHSVSALAVDIDHFKAFNDRLGHAEGDRILTDIGATLLRVTRAEDVVCRTGGEEFVIILPDTTVEAATRRAEEIRRAAQELGNGGRAVTLSVGVATFPQDGITPLGLLRAADMALYEAKRLGRNRVQLAEPPGDRPLR